MNHRYPAQGGAAAIPRARSGAHFFPSAIAARRRTVQASVFPGELRHADIAHLAGRLRNAHAFRQHQAAGVDQAQLLLKLQGRTCSAYPACAPEVRLSGGHYADIGIDQAHVDGNLVTAPAWPAHPQWLAKFAALLAE